MRLRCAVACGVFSVLAPLPVEAIAQTLDWRALADRVLERADLKPGERLLLIAQPGRFDPLVPLLRAGARAAGAIDLGALSVTESSPASWDTGFTRELKAKSGAELPTLLERVDLAIILPGALPPHPVYSAIQEVLREGHGRTIHFHWAGAFDLDQEPLTITPEIDRVYQQAILETDYEVLAERQRNFEQAMRGRRLRVTTPAGTDLSFEIGRRPVTRQDGDASAARVSEARNLIDREVEIPAGAVRVAPLEETVEGVIAFPPAAWRGQRAQGLKMRFERGRVLSIEAESGSEAVQTELDAAGDGARWFREFVLGMNPLLAIPQTGRPWIPYFGYGAGIVRLSLGDNSELGGNVSGGYVRWSFFTDATVTVGREVWVREGRLVQ